MGLDSVELLWRIEGEFGIKISDPEASSILTVGDLNATVLRKLEIAPTDQRAAGIWERLREAIVDETGVKRDAVVPSARISRDLGIN
jgi:acyl carrier protein